MLKPRVFISCGQREEGNERQAAERVREIVEKLGFEPYLAFQHQSLEGFKEGVLSHLRRSEYFLFIDFRREKVGKKLHRGSLFCRQELAVASSLELDVAIFVQEGLERNGILNYVMGNAKTFADEGQLLRAVRKAVGGWSKNWRNELRWELAHGEDAVHPVQNLLGENETYANVQVRNLHRSKPAFNCYAYLDSIQRIGDGGDSSDIDTKTIEFAWAGSQYANALIQPRQARLLNVCVRSGTGTRLSVNTTYSNYRPPLEHGEYNLEFVVYAQKFLPAHGRFKLTVQAGNPVLGLP